MSPRLYVPKPDESEFEIYFKTESSNIGVSAHAQFTQFIKRLRMTWISYMYRDANTIILCMFAGIETHRFLDVGFLMAWLQFVSGTIKQLYPGLIAMMSKNML